MEENKKEEVELVEEANTESEDSTVINTNSNVVDEFHGPVDIKSKEEVQETINNARISFHTAYNKEITKNRIMGFIFIGLMIGLVVIGYVLPQYVQYLLMGAIAFFGVVIILTRIAKRKMDIAVGDYLETYGLYSDSYVYQNDDIKDVLLDFKKKPDEEVVRSFRFNKDVFHIGSRDMIKGKVQDVEFETSDISMKAGDVKDKKSQKAVFVGKMVNVKLGYEDEGRVLMYLKGCGDAEPNDLEDVNNVTIEGLKEDWKVYSSNDSYKKIFTSEVVKTFNEFKVDEILNDIVISFQKERVLIGLSYTDDLMIIPLESDFKLDGLNHYKSDFEIVIKLLKAFSKNKYLK